MLPLKLWSVFEFLKICRIQNKLKKPHEIFYKRSVLKCFFAFIEVLNSPLAYRLPVALQCVWFNWLATCNCFWGLARYWPPVVSLQFIFNLNVNPQKYPVYCKNLLRLCYSQTYLKCALCFSNCNNAKNAYLKWYFLGRTHCKLAHQSQF